MYARVLRPLRGHGAKTESHPSRGDRKFESGSLQRRVCELSVPEHQAINPRNNLLRRLGQCRSGSAPSVHITPGSPWENGFIESFNARLRDELLDGEVFYTLREAQIVIESWPRQHHSPACLDRLPGSCSGGGRLSLRSMAGCAAPTSSAGHAQAGAKTYPKLTFNPDHQAGAGQPHLEPCLRSGWRPFRGACHLPSRLIIGQLRRTTDAGQIEDRRPVF